jgi:hypothetical protein
VRERWVRSYLGYYFELIEDDRHGVLKDSLVSRHFTTREEEHFKVCVVSFERLVIHLHQSVKCGLEDVALVEGKFIVDVVSTLHA